MNERELSLIKAVSEEFGRALASLRNEFTDALKAHQSALELQVSTLSAAFAEISAMPAPDIDALVREAITLTPVPAAPELPDIPAMVRDAVTEAVAALPVPADGKSVTVEDVQPLLQELVDKAVAEIPAPRDGKDYDPEVLKQAVAEAVAALPVPADGKSVTVEDVHPLLQELVNKAVPDVKSLVDAAVAAIPAPEPAIPGADGRDALQLEILPCIDEGKSYPRGSYANHNGGLWRAYQRTHGMHGWECIVDGIADVNIEQAELRNFTVTVSRSSGASDSKSFGIPTMIYRGVFKSGDAYEPGDTVTWGGSLWHCHEGTTDKPGETGSTGWTLAAKRGRDARGSA